MNHRKHVHGWEIDPVAYVLREHLIEMVPLHDPQAILPGDVIEQFHVLYRFENNRVGKPAYPGPESWETLATYLGVMVPLHLSESKQGQPHPTPNMSLRGEAPLNTPSQWDQMCPSCGKQSPNPNYCTSCGEALEVEA